jgi:hypothetical protein
VRRTPLRLLVLLGLDPVIREDAGPGPDGKVSDSRPGDVVAMPVVDERQAALFEDRAVLLRGLDHALEQGEFEDALRALRSFEAVYGPPAEGPPSPALESLAGACFGPAPLTRSHRRDLSACPRSRPSSTRPDRRLPWQSEAQAHAQVPVRESPLADRAHNSGFAVQADLAPERGLVPEPQGSQG